MAIAIQAFHSTFGIYFVTIDDMKLSMDADCLILYRFLKSGHINKKTAVRTLNQLAEFISNDEFSTVRLLMERIK